jgi:hypothetical protein
MSSQFPRVNSDPSLVVPPQPDTANDPFALVSGKLGDFLRNGGPVKSSIHRQMASKHLLDNMDAQPEGADPFDWEEGLKYKSAFDKSWEKGVAEKPKDPRLKKDKAGDKNEVEGKDKKDKAADKNEVEGKEKKEPRTLQELMDEEKASQKKASAFDGPQPYDKKKYYDKNSNHLDLGKTTDWVNQRAHETKVRNQELEASQAAEKEARKNGNAPVKDDTPTEKPGLFKERFDKTDVKRTGISAETHYGSYTPELREGSFSNIEIQRNSAHIGHEEVDRLNGGRGYSQTNAGLWGLTEESKRGGTVGGGMGARGEIVNVLDVGGGDLTVRANGLAGVEGSVGGKFKTKPYDTNISGGAEIRAGVFGEAGVKYRPVELETNVFGARLNVSPELEATGRVFNGGELGAGGKMGWRFVPDPVTGKMSPEIGVEAKGAAFIGGKAEGEVMVGSADIGRIGGSAAAMYGVGLEGKAALGLNKDDKGRLRLKGELKLGAALGLGASFGVKFDVNVDGLMRFGGNLIKANKAFFTKVNRTFHETTHKVAETAKKVVDKVEEVGKKVVDDVKKFGENVGNKVEEVANKVGDGVKKAAKKVENFFKKLF